MKLNWIGLDKSAKKL